jgi:hypothetical protein
MSQNERNHGPGPGLYRIPQGDRERKDAPIYRGVLGYFPAALFEVAAHSLESDRKHNANNPTAPNWARGKSADHEDCILRHLIDAGARRSADLAAAMTGGEPPSGSSALDARRYHLRSLAWRALALLQEDCEATGAAPGVSSVFPKPAPERAPLKTHGELELEHQRRVFGPCAHPAQHLAIDAFRREQAKEGAD